MRWAIFDEQAKLAPDLEWMLQSGQADRMLLAEALVNGYYLPVYRLALSLLNDEELADRLLTLRLLLSWKKPGVIPADVDCRPGSSAWR